MTFSRLSGLGDIRTTPLQLITLAAALGGVIFLGAKARRGTSKPKTTGNTNESKQIDQAES